MTQNTSRKKALILLVALIFIALIISVVRYQLTKTHFNEDFVNGNTAGNLYNAGLFCEKDGIIYFSNPSDNHKLYSMNSDGSDLTKLCDDTVSYINADEHYIYYVRNNTSNDSAFSFLNWNNNSLCRIKRSGGEILALDDAPSLYASLVGNYIYYIHYDETEASTLYRVKIDGSDKKQISKFPILPCSTNGAYIYYSGVNENHNIYRMDTNSNSSASILDANTHNPIVTGNIAYYLDCDNDYALTKADLSTGETTVLVDERIDCFNVTNSYIYYQRNDANSPALCRISTSGGESTEIIAGNYTDINVTSNYVYFYPYDNYDTCYCIATNGVGNVSRFHP